MEPFGALSGGARVARGRFALYIALQLTSVIAPGVVMVVELALILGKLGGLDVDDSVARLRDIRGMAGVIMALLLLAAAYVLGYVGRELAFKLVCQLEKLPRPRRRLNEDLHQRLCQRFGTRLVSDCQAAHRHFAEAEDRAPEHVPAPARTSDGGHVDDWRFIDFTYAKFWLRNYSPGFSVDAIEAEINILASTLPPTVLATLVVLVLADLPLWMVMVVVTLTVVVLFMLIDSVLRLRRTERWESLRNLVMDYAMRYAVTAYPAGAPAVGGTADPSDDQDE